MAGGRSIWVSDTAFNVFYPCDHLVFDGMTVTVDGRVVTISGGGGGTSNHASLSNLSWIVSGHTGTANRLAGFDGSGNAGLVTLTSPLSLSGGALSVDLSAYLTTAAAAATYLSIIDAATYFLTIADAALDYQPLDADLTALAGLGNGLPYRSGGSWGAYGLGDLAINAGAVEVTQARGLRESGGTTLAMATVADGELLRRVGTTVVGAALGAVVQAYSAILSAIAALSSTGLIARTGSGTVAARSLTEGAGITIVNGDGVSGNPTISFSGGTGQDDDPTASYTISITPSNATLFSRDSGITVRSASNGDTSQYRATALTGAIADFYTSVGVAQTGWNYTGYISFKVRLITGSNISATARYKMGWTNGGFTRTDSEAAGRPTAMFRYITGLGQTNWMCYNLNATSSEQTDSGIAVATSTVYLLEIRLTATSTVFLINGATVATHTTYLPPTTASMQIQCGNYATTRSLSIIGARMNIQWT